MSLWFSAGLTMKAIVWFTDDRDEFADVLDRFANDQNKFANVTGKFANVEKSS